jgi:hypothetical protein
MPKIQPPAIDAEQWFPGVKIAGVEEETRVAKAGDPEVTHGLMLLKDRPPLTLKTKAVVDQTISAGRAHLQGKDGHSTLVEYGDWVVSSPDGVEVLSDAEFKTRYGAGK